MTPHPDIPPSPPSGNFDETLVRPVAETGGPDDRPSPAPPPSALFTDHYRLQQPIGKGGEGTVYSVVDCQINREIAMKIVADTADDETRQRFIRQAQLTGRLEHPNIIPIHELGRDAAGKPYFTMKRVRGRTLTDLLDQLPAPRDRRPTSPPWNSLMRIFLNICDAIAYAHAHRVIHRDLKPDNIMVGEFGEVLVMDWGLAKRLTAPETDDAPAITGPSPARSPEPSHDLFTQDSAIMGSPGYMAPEQITGPNREVDEASDIYALGAILYTMLTRTAPVTGETCQAVLTRTVQGQIPPPEQAAPHRVIPKELAAIALRALATRKTDRYGTVTALRQDIERFMESRSVSAKRDTPLESGVKFVRRHTGVSIAAGIAALMLLAVGSAATVTILRARQARLAAEVKTLKLEAERQEEWLPVCDLDFTRMPTLDERLDVLACNAPLSTNRTVVSAPHVATLSSNGLTLTAGTNAHIMARWKPPVNENMRVRVVFHDTFMIRITVEGDSLTGYRLLAVIPKGYHDSGISLDTIMDGNYRIFLRGIDLLVDASRHEMMLENDGQKLRATVDGKDAFAWITPLPVRGPSHRTFAINTSTRCVVERLQAWQKRAPQVVPVLEAGRELMRREVDAAAEDFFRQQLLTYQGTAIGAEAEVYLALALQKQGRETEALSLLQNMNPDRSGIVSAIAFETAAAMYAKRDEFESAVTNALAAARLMPHSSAPMNVATMVVKFMETHVDWSGRKSTLASDRSEELIRLFACLPIKQYGLKRLALTSLNGFEQVPLTQLDVDNNYIQSLAPLRNQRLNQFFCNYNPILDLTPLADMPLTQLECAYGRIRDLTPVRRMPLQQFNCKGNEITDLTPLAHTPLITLDCSDNRIDDLTPIADLRLNALYCFMNRIRDLRPLIGQPLEQLHFQNNQVPDLAPVRGMPLMGLSCGQNPIADLQPLAGLKLHELDCRGIPLTAANAIVVRALPLAHFTLDLADPAAPALIRQLPELITINQFRATYVVPMLEDLHRALRREPVNLKPYAVAAGDVAYLAVPAFVSLREAEDFARSQGGILACPATESQRAALVRYLFPIQAQSLYWIGVHYDPATDSFSWTSGEPWQKTYVYQYPNARYAKAQLYVSPNGVFMLCAALQPEAPFVIEWPAEATAAH